jgi:hypothetical protein
MAVVTIAATTVAQALAEHLPVEIPEVLQVTKQIRY